MRLSEAGVKAAGVAGDGLTFGALQTAVTASELIVQLCLRAVNSR